MAIAAPWPWFGVIAWAASPSSITRGRPQNGPVQLVQVVVQRWRVGEGGQELPDQATEVGGVTDRSVRASATTPSARCSAAST
jgi:hypothetical protein